MDYKKKFRDITSFIFDVDGVFTDGSITIMENGEMVRTMNTKDGYAVKAALEEGYNIAVITGGTNKAVKDRLNQLGVLNVYLGCHEKQSELIKYSKKNFIDLKKTIYMGDDIPDLPAMKIVGLSCCPKDSVQEVLDFADYVSHKNGGEGCVRDIIEQVMKVQGRWGKLKSARIT